MKVYAQTLKFNDGSGMSFQVTGDVSWAKKIGDIINRSMDYVFLFAGVALLLMLLAGGFKFLTSGGDPKKMQSGQQQVTWALVGFVLIFVSFFIVQIAEVMFGLEFGF